VELLSNLVWIAVAFALWCVWLAERRRARGASVHSGNRVQLVALGLLSLILLPVISVSDDLQASHNPAEVERSCLRNDHLLLPDAPPPAPATLAAVVTCLLLASPRTIAFLCPPASPRGEQMAYLRVFASRPPPAA
jgi:hypothetical protein